jgi:hypothetical protein
MNNLLHYRNQKNFESILSLLTDALPNNAEVQAKLDTLITKRVVISKNYSGDGFPDISLFTLNEISEK